MTPENKAIAEQLECWIRASETKLSKAKINSFRLNMAKSSMPSLVEDQEVQALIEQTIDTLDWVIASEKAILPGMKEQLKKLKGAN